MQYTYKTERIIDGNVVETIHGEPEPQRLDEIVTNRPQQSFIVYVREFNPETKRAGQWERLYTVSAETAAIINM